MFLGDSFAYFYMAASSGNYGTIRRRSTIRNLSMDDKLVGMVWSGPISARLEVRLASDLATGTGTGNTGTGRVSGNKCSIGLMLLRWPI